MSESVKCQQCKGQGSYDALVSQHDDKKVEVKCTNCNGTGVIHQMSEQDERDYYADYW